MPATRLFPAEQRWSNHQDATRRPFLPPSSPHLGTLAASFLNAFSEKVHQPSLRFVQHPWPGSRLSRLPWQACYLALGDHDRMFAWFDRAYEAHEPSAALQVLPWLDGVRSDPRFRAHIERIGQSEQYISTNRPSRI